MIQQQVEEIKFEQVYIQKLQAKAIKTHKIRDWLSLLSAYEENSQFEKKDSTILDMHSKFILREDFWMKEINRKLSNNPITQADIQFCFLALDDGYYSDSGLILYKRLLKQLNEKQPNLRPNFVIAKLQKLISLLADFRNFFPGLRSYYQKKNNTKKVREMYLRQISQTYDNFDIIYDEYKLWEEDQSHLPKAKQSYEKAKQNWENRYKKRISLFLFDPDSASFDSYYCLQAIEYLPTEIEKLWHLRRICLSRHELVNEYLEKMEYVHFEDEQIILKTYKNILMHSQQAQMPYLRFLLRRINKHVQGAQSEQYNNKWADNVQFFRKEISELIGKPRLTPKTEQSIRQQYYKFWIDAETSLIKDKDSVSQLCQNLLKVKRTVQNYTKYSKCLIRLGYIAEAKQILKRSCQAFKFDFEAHKQYESFISIYGTLNDFIEFRKMKNSQKIQKKDEQGVVPNVLAEKEQNKQRQIKVVKKIDPILMEQNYENLQKQKKQVKGFRRVQKQSKEVQQLIQKHECEKKEQVEEKAVKRQKSEVPNMNGQGKTIEQNEAPRKRMHADGGNTIFIKGLPKDYDQNFIRQLITHQQKIKDIRIIDKNGVKKNYCYVEMDTQQTAEQEVTTNQNKHKYYIAISKPPTSYTQEKTIFLCALPDNITQSKIKQFFSEWQNNILEIRLKLNEGKNLAYVDFDCESNKNSALEKWKEQVPSIDGKKIIVRDSNSHKINQHKKQTNVIILKKLAFKATQKQIRTFFGKKDIEDVYIPNNEQGKPKGFAFVKFWNNRDYFDALDMKQGTIKGRKFQIHKSDRDIQRPKKINTQKSRDNNFFQSLLQ